MAKIRDLAKYRKEWIARVKSKVAINERGCWEWLGLMAPEGYGRVSYLGGTRHVHRAMYQAFHEMTLLTEQYVCHSCDNGRCCNPEHLWLGSNSDNQQDAIRKGRNYWLQRTHCGNGHEFTPENTYQYKDRRRCKTCARLMQKKYEARS